MALRNELRRPSGFLARIIGVEGDDVAWQQWYGNMTEGAAAIHSANPDLLIFFSGLDLSRELRPIFTSSDLTQSESGLLNSTNAFEYADKIVLEVHDYYFLNPEVGCDEREGILTHNALAAINGTDRAYPVVMSEWGYNQQAPSSAETQYASCMAAIFRVKTAGWMIWALGGSYYIRDGIQNYDETYGLLGREWRDWRCPDCIESLEGMVDTTLASVKRIP